MIRNKVIKEISSYIPHRSTSCTCNNNTYLLVLILLINSSVDYRVLAKYILGVQEECRCFLILFFLSSYDSTFILVVPVLLLLLLHYYFASMWRDNQVLLQNNAVYIHTAHSFLIRTMNVQKEKEKKREISILWF